MLKRLFVALSLVLFVAGCNQAQSSANEATAVDLSIDDQRRCHQCGMMITKYPGPKGVVVLKGQPQSLAFCSSRDMFQFALQPQNQRQIELMKVHDMGQTDWAKPSDDAFIDAETAVYVYGTSAKGVMGPAVAPFATEAAAQAHIDQFGGSIYRFEQITLELLNQGGMNKKGMHGAHKH